MRSNSHDLSFTLFGFPTTIQPFFWLTAALISAISLGGIENMPIWLVEILLTMFAILISILVHELGHALVFRYGFNTPSIIILHHFGGATMPTKHYSQGYGLNNMIVHCFLSFAGPLAGFALGLLMLFIKLALPENNTLSFQLFDRFLFTMIWISIVWGFFNLLPIYPMDGGHIVRSIFLFFSHYNGIKYSLILSMMCCALFAVLALRSNNNFIAFFFAFFAYQNYQEMTFRSFRR